MPKREQITSYHALKGIGALGILFSHMSYLGASASPFWKSLYLYFMKRGAVFTTLFVLFSGFFLDYAWRDQSFSSYVKGKLKRIYPLSFLVFLAALLVDLFLPGNGEVNQAAAGSGLWLFNIAANVFLFKAFVPIEATFYSFHGPSWYISVLFGLYLFAYPFVKGLHGTDPASAGKWRRRLLLVCVLAYAGELLICLLTRLKGWDSLWLCYINPFFRIFGEGFAGIALCESMSRRQWKLARPALAEWLAAALLLAAILFRNTGLAISSAWIQLLPMGFAMLVFRNGAGPISALLNSKAMQFLGDISFELYMTHAFVYEGLPVAVGILSRRLRSLLIAHAPIRFAITLVLCLVFAWLVHRFMNWLNRTLIYRKRG